jgi:hypothetical protein
MGVPFHSSPTSWPAFVGWWRIWLWWDGNSVILIFVSSMAQMLNISSFIYWPFVCLLRNVVQFICPFNWIICSFGIYFLSSLYILDINPLSNEQLTKIFPHSVVCSFMLVIVSFAVHKLFNLIQYHSSILAIISWTIGVLQNSFYVEHFKDFSEKVALSFGRMFMIGLIRIDHIHWENWRVNLGKNSKFIF